MPCRTTRRNRSLSRSPGALQPRILGAPRTTRNWRSIPVRRLVCSRALQLLNVGKVRLRSDLVRDIAGIHGAHCETSFPGAGHDVLEGWFRALRSAFTLPVRLGSETDDKHGNKHPRGTRARAVCVRVACVWEFKSPAGCVKKCRHLSKVVELLRLLRQHHRHDSSFKTYWKSGLSFLATHSLLSLRNFR